MALEADSARILELVPIGVVVVDEDGRFSFVNPAAERILGKRRDEIIGHAYTEPVWELATLDGRAVPPDERPPAIVVRTGKAVHRAEYGLVRPDGSIAFLAVDAMPFSNGSGEPVGTLVSFTDISDAKRRERLNSALNDINNEIASSLDFDAIMQDTVDRAVEALDCESGIIYLKEDEAWVMRYLHELPDALKGTEVAEEDFAFAKLSGEWTGAIAFNDIGPDELIDSHLPREYRTQSLLAEMLTIRGERIGAMSFHYHSRPVPFSEEDVQFVNQVGVAVGLALENARLYADESEIANTLQAALLEAPAELPNMEFGHVYRSGAKHAEVGGDLYDVFALDDGKTAILIGDVAGKGLLSATLASRAKATAKAYLYDGDTPHSAAEKTNELIVHSAPANPFVTAFLSVFDPTDGRLAYCNAGHPPALLKRLDGTVERLLGGASPVLGAFSGLEFLGDEVMLRPGETLLLYTDGVIEARRGKGFFGEERLVESLRRHTESAADMPQAVLDDVIEYTGGAISDDVAILALTPLGRSDTTLPGR